MDSLHSVYASRLGMSSAGEFGAPQVAQVAEGHFEGAVVHGAGQLGNAARLLEQCDGSSVSEAVQGLHGVRRGRSWP